LLRVAVTDIDLHPSGKQSGLKIVCEACGSLSIRPVDPAAPEATPIHCGRCNAVRGTLADLHDLARRSTDVFEF
jgi:hypothetical protein